LAAVHAGAAAKDDSSLAFEKASWNIVIDRGFFDFHDQ
jgi:hypothetical protein